jgi:citrate lyase subunit alpha / citrate CoA-transferase
MKLKNLPKGFYPYLSANDYLNKERILIEKTIKNKNVSYLDSIKAVFDLIPIKDGMTLSFHHHLRNGDYVLNMVLEEIKIRNLKEITIASSAIFPVHEPLVELIKNQQVTTLITNYINGPVADIVSKGYLKNYILMDTHGGRPRALESGQLIIDVAFIATPAVDKSGNGSGVDGKSACGTLGYAISDLEYAKTKVLVTDTILDALSKIDLDYKYVDYVVKVLEIGNPKGIVSGTTKPTKDPVQLKIARDTAKLIDELGFIQNGMSFQTGAGGTSLAVSLDVKEKMKEKQVKGSFASGGITHFLVDMQKEGLFNQLYDVQCFDLEAIESYKYNQDHHFMSASKYGNPFDQPVVDNLDVVILGATEIDLNFNVNVTTDSKGSLMGGSGGHSDTAHGAKLTIITTNLVKSRTSIVRKHVTTITTPGESIDCLVTERGIAINPKRTDLIEKLKDSQLKILTIEDLYQKAISMTGEPKIDTTEKEVIGYIRYRDGSIIDLLYKTKE